jgi:hypothetical protein
MRQHVRMPSPAMVVALIALFVALGGVSYAIKRNSVGSAAIKDGSVGSRDVRDGGLRGNDLANGTVLSRDVKDGAIRGADVNDRALGGRDIATNSLGDREIDEPQLDVQRLAGIDASRYVKRVRTVRTQTGNDASTPKVARLARCPRGKRLVGGGARVVAPRPVPVALSTNGPSGNGWAATAYATAPAGSWQLVSVAICG